MNTTIKKSLPHLKGDHFEKEVIFARFYLPIIFHDLEMFIYLDNDVIVTLDIHEIHLHAFDQSCDDFLRQSNGDTHPSPSIARSKAHIPSNRFTKARPHHTQKESFIIAFVVEYHPFYANYLKDHFNLSHPLVAAAMRHFSHKVFLNGGVFVVDAKRWRDGGITQRTEQLIEANSASFIYDSRVGDQAVFYSVLHEHMACLPPQWNMRRLPKKTVQMLQTNLLGKEDER